jgi:lysophospholipase L1-like esterase
MNKLWPRQLAAQAWMAATCMALTAALAACGGGGGSDSVLPNPGSGGYPGGADIIAWGDSWTSGVGAPNGLSYPDQLRALSARPVFNAGVSGQTSDQIAARQGGAPALLTLPNDRLPMSGLVAIEDESTLPVSAEGPGPITGTLSGVRGTLSFSGNLFFDRNASGAPLVVPPASPFDPDTFDSRSVINVFWMGGNNFYDPERVKSDIASAVAFLATGKFVVLGILNAASEPIGSPAYVQLTQLNDDLAASYPDNFIDIRRVLVESYDPSVPQDVVDHANDVPPGSLRNDDQHPNEAGYAIVAQQVDAFIRMKGW